MITPSRLAVTEYHTISLIHQVPDAVPAPEVVEEPTPSFKKKKVKVKPPQKPLIVMMHDFPGTHMAGNNDLFGELAYQFEKLGYASARFDFRGAGDSDCTASEFSLESATEDLNAVLDWAKHEQKYKSVVLLGEGVGGAVAVMGYRAKIIAGMILLWPTTIMRESGFKELFTREKLLKAAEMDAPFVEYRGFRLGSHFLHEIYNTDLTSSLERIKVPVLIQAGTGDPDIALDQAYFARDNIKGLVELAVFEGGGPGLKEPKMRKHLFVNIEHFLTRVLKRLATPPKT